MTYEILNRHTTITTVVRYDFGELGEVEVSIPHFQPKDEAEIIKGIENRAITERRKLEQEQAQAE